MCLLMLTKLSDYCKKKKKKKPNTTQHRNHKVTHKESYTWEIKSYYFSTNINTIYDYTHLAVDTELNYLDTCPWYKIHWRCALVMVSRLRRIQSHKGLSLSQTRLIPFAPMTKEQIQRLGFCYSHHITYSTLFKCEW